MIQAKTVNLMPGMSLGQVINPIVDNRFIDYVRDNFQQNYQMLQQIGGRISDSMQQLFSHFTSNEYINKARDIALEVGLRNDVSIYPVNCDNIYDAGMVMAGYVMANPTVWNMYSKFRLDGYEDMFTMSDINETNPYRRQEYMQVMDGMVQFDESGYEYRIYSHSGEDLSLMEKLTVLDAWDCAEFLIDNGIDPTSREKNEL